MTKKQARDSASNKEFEIIYMPVELLCLDKENPRLASAISSDDQKELDQKDLIRVLWTEMAVNEVALSIAENGFFREEPLFVIPKGTDIKKYIVVEGNRRLAAVLLLRDDKLREELRATELPKLSHEKKAGLDRLPVSIYKSREDLWQYFGFRHINGPKEWDAFSKAQYVAKVHEEYDIPLDKISRKIGDYHSTVKRLYRGYVLLRQAESMTDFNREDRIRNRFYFSHLYTAADQPEFQKFLGIDANRSLGPDPVNKPKLENLYELMVWLYGRKPDKPPIVTKQNPDLNILREVISKPNALSALRAGFSLEKSYEIARGDERRFREALTKAREDMVQANGVVTTGYSGERDLYEVIEDILIIARKIEEEMKNKLINPSSKPRKN